LREERQRLVILFGGLFSGITIFAALLVVGANVIR